MRPRVASRFQLDPAGGAALKAALDLHAAPTPATTVTTGDGQQTLIGEDRTPGQRYADALVAIARKALQDTNPHDTTGRPLTHITVITTPDHLTTPTGSSSGDSSGSDNSGGGDGGVTGW